MASVKCCAKSLGKAVINIAERTITNKPSFIPLKKRNERLEICNNCDKLIDGRCDLCGCFMKVKTWFAAMECPADEPKWKSE